MNKKTPAEVLLDGLSMNIEKGYEPSGLCYPKDDNIRQNPDKLNLKQQENLCTEDKRRRYNQDTKDRSALAHRTFWLIVGWLVSVVIILMYNTESFFLSDKVLFMLLGTTTINVLGLAFVVLKGYFEHMDQNVKI